MTILAVIRLQVAVTTGMCVLLADNLLTRDNWLALSYDRPC